MELIIKCEECDSFLDGDISGKRELYVTLCPTCEKRIRDEAHSEGYDEGYEEGNKE